MISQYLRKDLLSNKPKNHLITLGDILDLDLQKKVKWLCDFSQKNKAFNAEINKKYEPMEFLKNEIKKLVGKIKELKKGPAPPHEIKNVEEELASYQKELDGLRNSDEFNEAERLITKFHK